jgi:hypothetical protein
MANHGRLHAGEPIAMAADATNAYIAARAQGNDAAIIGSVRRAGILQRRFFKKSSGSRVATYRR